MDSERRKQIEKLAEQLRETQKIQQQSVMNKHYSYEFEKDGLIYVTEVTIDPRGQY